VQFKLHETYANALRTVEAPPFEVTETGWGEFEIQIKLYFVSESNEKPQTLWHGLKLHPYGPDAEGQKERGDAIVSQNYEEVLFNEPAEQFYDILTGGGGVPTTNKGKSGKGAKFAQQQAANGRTAEIPYADSPGNPYSKKAESDEIDRLLEAFRTVEAMKTEEQAKLAEREKKLEALRKTEGVAVKKK
jgi:YEATS domain-containing protein 4